MNISALIKNPWAWGIAAAAGIVVIAIANSPKGENDTAFNPNNVSSLNGLQSAQNNAGAAYAESMAGIAANANINFEQQKTTRSLKIIDAIQSASGVFTTVMEQMNETAAGVTNSLIQQQTALAVDRNANETRRNMIYVAGDVSKATAQLDGRVSVTNNLISTQAAKDKIQADASTSAMSTLFDFGKALAGMAV